MKTVVTTRVGANGVLNLTLPLSKDDEFKAVRVTVETMDEVVGTGIPADHEAWLRFIERTAGSITDPTFERHAQGELEERDPLP